MMGRRCGMHDRENELEGQIQEVLVPMLKR